MTSNDSLPALIWPSTHLVFTFIPSTILTQSMCVQTSSAACDSLHQYLMQQAHEEISVEAVQLKFTCYLQRWMPHIVQEDAGKLEAVMVQATGACFQHLGGCSSADLKHADCYSLHGSETIMGLLLVCFEHVELLVQCLLPSMHLQHPVHIASCTFCLPHTCEALQQVLASEGGLERNQYLA